MSLQAIQIYHTTSAEMSRDDTNVTPVKNPVINLTKKKLTQQQRNTRKREQHRKIPNQCSCSNPCSSKISKNGQTELNESYWSCDFRGKRNFMRKYITQELVKTRRDKKTTESPKKNATFKYELNDEAGERHIICRTFF